jgi:bifunctional non-homologous end joining protein LigD
MVIRQKNDGTSPHPPPPPGLEDYRDKRDFAATPEPPPTPEPQQPKPKQAKPKQSESQRPESQQPKPRGADGDGDEALPRFVIHEHHAARLHWDLRLERGDTLASWAVPKGLPLAPGENHLAVAVEDHPLEYLDFEQEIPKGQYGAGRVTIWDRGTYELLKWEPRKVEVALHGQRESARYALFPIDKDEHPKNWLIHRMDPPGDPSREAMPTKLAPMLAHAGGLPPEDGRWGYEIKWDGVRALAYSQPGELRLESRTLKDITDTYPELLRLGAALGSHSAVLDGEMVAFDEAGRPSFAALQRRMHTSSRAQARAQAKATPVTYVLFDLLWLDGHSLMGEPYVERRRRLGELVPRGDCWQTPEHTVDRGAELLAASGELGLEGIVAKRLDSPYRPGARSGEWVKVKRVARQELVVGGWLPGRGKRSSTIGALLLGVYEDGGGLRYAGRVGSGFDERELARLSQLLVPLGRPDSPFTAGERPPREAVFCEPRLVVEVEFARWTKAGSLRHPVYVGLREDKPAADVSREDDPAADVAGERETRRRGARASRRPTVDGRELKLSNLSKVLYPQVGFTKGDLIDFYSAISPVLLAHLHGRALTVTRWPDGVEGKSFFQKQSPAHRPEWVRTARISSATKPIDYTLGDDLPTLVWLANLAAVELHVPLALADAIERPTAVVFDLDPGPPATVIECCRVALLLHDMFEHLGPESFVKTSGSKGLQLYLPLNRPDVTFADTKPFAKAVAELLEQSEPDLVVSRMTKARREGRVLIDWSQNDQKKTTVCAYSLRATPRPTVSTPLEWDEVRAALDAGDPALLAFEAHDVLERVAAKGDLFAPVLSLVQGLPR